MVANPVTASTIPLSDMIVCQGLHGMYILVYYFTPIFKVSICREVWNQYAHCVGLVGGLDAIIGTFAVYGFYIHIPLYLKQFALTSIFCAYFHIAGNNPWGVPGNPAPIGLDVSGFSQQYNPQQYMVSSEPRFLIFYQSWYQPSNKSFILVHLNIYDT